MKYKGYSCHSTLPLCMIKCIGNRMILMLCEMLKSKIQMNHYVYVVTSSPWIMHEKTKEFILIVCPSTF